MCNDDVDACCCDFALTYVIYMNYFSCIQINASDWRNGALVKQKFGEAVESHWLQRFV